jgi:hypothetical protein
MIYYPRGQSQLDIQKEIYKEKLEESSVLPQSCKTCTFLAEHNQFRLLPFLKLKIFLKEMFTNKEEIGATHGFLQTFTNTRTIPRDRTSAYEICIINIRVDFHLN